MKKQRLDEIDLTIVRGPPYLSRSHLITEIQIALIRKELRHLKQNIVQCPDTDASFASIESVLTMVKGSES
jgi:hypothetical protein